MSLCLQNNAEATGCREKAASVKLSTNTQVYITKNQLLTRSWFFVIYGKQTSSEWPEARNT
jgi:hypothetical protein